MSPTSMQSDSKNIALKYIENIEKLMVDDKNLRRESDKSVSQALEKLVAPNINETKDLSLNKSTKSEFYYSKTRNDKRAKRNSTALDYNDHSEIEADPVCTYPLCCF